MMVSKFPEISESIQITKNNKEHFNASYYEEGHLELYNLVMDLGQRKNLVQMYPEKTKELKTLLDNWKKNVDAPVPTKLDPEFEPGNCPDNTILEKNIRHSSSHPDN